jgi:cardiolipin synthase A/B
MKASAPASVTELGSHVGVMVQPDDGVEPVLALLRAAQSSVLVKQFTLAHPAIVAALIDARRLGRAVRVMLNPHRSSGDRANDETFERLQKEGVEVAWSNPKFAVTHEKSLVVDDRVAVIATFNMMEKYFTVTRDYGLVITDPHEVAQIRAGFDADWDRADFHPDPASALLWSNWNSRIVMSHFIDTAEERIDIQHPKFVDATILERIVKARARGVEVRVLCGGKHGISTWDMLDTFSSLHVMQRFGVRVHKQRHLRLHAKLILVDRAHALVGSMNIDRSAFDLRRELGIAISDPDAVDRLRRVFHEDWEESRHYDPPDPLQAIEHVEDDFPHDPEFQHE